MRKRLARRLGLIATVCLLTVFTLALLAAWIGVLSACAAWENILAERWLAGAGYFVSSMAECVFSGALLHMLYMPVPMPVGIRLPPEEAPWLFRLIKGMAHVAAAENIDHVWIVSDMNAAILQRPRLAGCIGRVETHLLIGLPLLHSVSPQQLTAVLAHEFAHLAVQRKGMDKYASMLRAWCLRVLDSVEVVSPLCAALMDRGLRCLYDDMIRLARIEEFEADALATRLVDTRLLGEALIEVSLKANFLIKDFWKRILAQVERRAMPRMRPYRDMSLGVAVGFIRSAMESALIDDTHPHSLHPSLRERLSALHAPPPRGTESATTAAAYYLSPLLRDMERAFDRDWWHAVRSDWWRSYRAARRMRKKRKSRKNMNSTRISSRS